MLCCPGFPERRSAPEMPAPPVVWNAEVRLSMAAVGVSTVFSATYATQPQDSSLSQRA